MQESDNLSEIEHNKWYCYLLSLGNYGILEKIPTGLKNKAAKLFGDNNLVCMSLCSSQLVLKTWLNPLSLAELLNALNFAL